MVNLDREEYIRMTKDTLKFFSLAAFT